MSEDILIDLGLSQNEAKVYTSLLKIGLTTTTHISKDSKIHRSNVYDSVKKLIGKGLVSYVKKENVTLYEANHPQSLLTMLKQKENRFKTILPQLMLSKKLAAIKGEAHIFEGVPALIDILYGLIEYKEPILIYGLPIVAPEMVKNYIPHFHKARIRQNIPMKHIYNCNAQERISFLNKMKHTYARYLPESFDSQVSTCVCGEQVIFTIWTTPLMSIQIKNKLISDSYKKYFSLLWKAAKI